MAHPLRLRMLSLVTGAAMSASEVARELDVAHASASYHLRALADAGLVQRIDAADEQTARGPGRPPVRYRHVADYGSRLDREDGREAATNAMLQDLRRRLDARADQHRIDDAEVWLQPHTYARICALSDEISELMHGEALAPRTEGAVHASVTTAVFLVR
jgi:DNA-binding transcriptional ArsR family regulator